MGAEIGATTSLFAYDPAMSRYLTSTSRADVAAAADAVASDLRADDEVLADPSAFFDQVIEIDLSSLKPLINGPHTPDRARKVSELGAEAKAEGWPMEISSALIGSCTNSSYEDISRAAAIARFAHQNGLSTKTPLLVTPGSEQVRATIERDGLLADLEQIGATVLANACGPCIGQWSRSDVEEGTENIIITSYNRNFPKRNDGLASTLAFVTSPETVVAMALSGRVDFDPTTDSLTNVAGEQVTIPVPVGVELPPKGFTPGENTFIAPPADSSKVVVKVSPTSDRLQLLEPFDAWDGNDFLNLPILMKAKGKCTTDHISAAGPWLKYRGHLENISGNMFIGAVNAFTDEVGQGKDQLDGTTKSFPDIGKSYHAAGQGWIAIGDENYGEGSSREHAAMEPRFRGAKVVLTRSFARIHETNLKKQGVLPLVFADPKVYDLIEQDDRINVLGLANLTPDVPVKCQIVKPDGTTIDFEGIQTMNDEQIGWFKAGGALNIIRQRQGV
jgi:aconitate hydratase